MDNDVEITPPFRVSILMRGIDYGFSILSRVRPDPILRFPIIFFTALCAIFYKVDHLQQNIYRCQEKTKHPPLVLLTLSDLPDICLKKPKCHHLVCGKD